MEKTIEKEVIDIERTHEFYCDECGKKIYESIECDDGWYETPDKNKFELFVSMKTEYGGYDKSGLISVGSSIKKMLCDDCASKLELKFRKYMSEFGFEF